MEEALFKHLLELGFENRHGNLYRLTIENGKGVTSFVSVEKSKEFDGLFEVWSGYEDSAEKDGGASREGYFEPINILSGVTAIAGFINEFKATHT